MRIIILLLFIILFCFAILLSQDLPDYEGGFPDGCTTITVGKLAMSDSSVVTSHTCDSHRTRSWFDITPARDHKKNSELNLVKRFPYDSLAMPTYTHKSTGDIPQVEHTNGYINTAYPCMNDKQLAIGESTFGGRKSLQSENGLIDCQQLVRLMLERSGTAREAIKLGGELTQKYGYNDAGECLTIADKNEVWHFEIVGPGKGNTGSVWVAQRVPDDHIAVNANASRISEIDLSNPDYFLASENIFQVAQDSGWWNPEDGSFKFNYVYNPGGRTSFAARRREWRVLALSAPSLNLDANAESFPFSVKPDSLIDLPRLIAMFQDYYENTPYNFIKDLTWVNEDNKTEISPLANPFMPYDMNKLFRINGGWGWRGERTIARWYTMYATITQSRSHFPDEVGGVVWMAIDNVASSIYVPLYCSITDVADPYKAPGRSKGYNRESAWWAFNRLGTLAAQRWGDMRHDVTNVWQPMQAELLANQEIIEKKVLKLLKSDPEQARAILTQYGKDWGNKVVKRAWKLGDELWTKYDEKF